MGQAGEVKACALQRSAMFMEPRAQRRGTPEECNVYRIANQRGRTPAECNVPGAQACVTPLG